jgi:hypothetical protein
VKVNRRGLTQLVTLSCVAALRCLYAADGCLSLEGKDAAAHLEYLRGDRSKLEAACIAAAMEYVSAKHYSPAAPVLIQYLDYHEPGNPGRSGKRAIIVYAYPAVSALWSLGKPIVPLLAAAVADEKVAELVRQNAAETIFLIYGADNPEGITVMVRAAHAQSDPIAALRLMDQARRLASRCLPASRNDCENEVLK